MTDASIHVATDASIHVATDASIHPTTGAQADPPARIGFDRQSVEMIVAEVVRRLHSSRSGDDSADVHVVPTASPIDNADVVLVDRNVISVSVIENWTSNLAYHLSPRCVVTPSARDELRDRKIDWRFVDATPSEHENHGERIIPGLSSSRCESVLLAVNKNLRGRGVTHLSANYHLDDRPWRTLRELIRSGVDAAMLPDLGSVARVVAEIHVDRWIVDAADPPGEIAGRIMAAEKIMASQGSMSAGRTEAPR